ncbi:MAG: hypothetical protein OHK0024_27330 [Thalassobaculales bacterium]
MVALAAAFGLAAGAGLAGSGGPAGAAEALDLRISHQWMAGNDTRDGATREFARFVEARDPAIRFRVYPGRSLIANPVAQLDALQAGTLEMAVYPPAMAAARAPELAITAMPGTVTSLSQARRLRQGPFRRALQEVASAHGFRLLTWWWAPGAFIGRSRPLDGPESVRGLALRSMEPGFAALLAAAGAEVRRLPLAEVAAAFRAGALDGALMPVEAMLAFRLYEVAGHLTLAEDWAPSMQLLPLVIATPAWEALGAERQALFAAAADHADDWFHAAQEALLARAAAAFRSAGASVAAPAPDAREAWTDLARRRVWPDFAGSVPGGSQWLALTRDPP